jgi:hypothetical protein
MATVTIHGFLRQNAWGKATNHISTVQETHKVHCPWGHTHRDVTDYLADPAHFHKKFAHTFTEFPTGSLLLVAEAGNPIALVVRLTEGPQTGILSHYAVLRDAHRPCGHALTQPGRGCEYGCAACEDSVQKVVRADQIVLKDCMEGGSVIEPFHTIWRPVEIVGHICLEEHESIHEYSKFRASIHGKPITIPTEWIV